MRALGAIVPWCHRGAINIFIYIVSYDMRDGWTRRLHDTFKRDGGTPSQKIHGLRIVAEQHGAARAASRHSVSLNRLV